MKKQKSTLIEFKGFLSFLILHELSIKKLTGDQLAKKIGKRKNTKLTPGTIYPALKNLKKMKLIDYDQFGRDKKYFLTSTGKSYLRNLYKTFSRYFLGLKKFIKRF